jgi:hypothetical protein
MLRCVVRALWYSSDGTSAQSDGTSGSAKPSIENQNTEEQLNKEPSQQAEVHSGVGHVRVAYSLLMLVATVATLVG